MKKSQYIDYECSDSDSNGSTDNNPSSKHNGYDSSDMEETEEDRAFIDDCLSEEDKFCSSPIIKPSKKPKLGALVIGTKEFKKIIGDDDDIPEITCAQPLLSPPSQPLDISPTKLNQETEILENAQKFDDDIQLDEEEDQPVKKVVDVLDKDATDKAIEIGNNAPIVEKSKKKKKASKASSRNQVHSDIQRINHQSSSSNIEGVINKISNDQSRYKKDRSLIVIEMIKYLQKYK